MSFKDITVHELDAVEGRVLVDVRSPGEFAEGTIPGSVNVPLFTNEERALIGTVYKQESPDAARRLAMLTVSPKIPQIVAEMETLMKKGKLVIYCWRGGMRSYAACTFMSLLKYPVLRVRGGYRAYRQRVMEELTAYEGIKSPLIVLHGMTGVGKTRILLMLKERGQQVLDLEGMANHRGSVFGTIGMGEAHNQKTFEALLWESLRSLDPNRPVFMEAESKRIGRSVMPDWLIKDKQAGVPVFLNASMEQRVERLIEDYMPHDDQHIVTGLTVALEKIRKRLSNEQFAMFQDLLSTGEYERFCSQLFELYYDPRYKHKLQEYSGEMIHMDAEDLGDVVLELETLAQGLHEQRGKERGMTV